MFFHIFKYRIIQLFHEKELIGWVFAFPLLLGTMFYCSFGQMIGSDSDNFKVIPIALVSESNQNSSFEEVLNQLSQDNDDQMFQITKTSNEEALKLLDDSKIDGIIYSTTTPTITVSKDGINQSILKAFNEQYIQKEYMIKEITTKHPEKLSDTIKLLSENISFNKEVSLTNATTMDPLSQYFYALIAMTCLYGAIIGLNTVTNLQANLSALGARREVSPTHKLTVILGDFCASVIVNYMSVLLLFFYLIVILKVDFGSKIALILLSSFAGSVIGVANGTFLSSIGKWSAKTKESMIFAFTMLCCFLGGLIYNPMKDIIEHTCPIVNRLNAAALISDCLYSLNMYDTYDRFISDIAIMGIMALLLCLGSYLLLRRNKYANI